MGCAVSAQDSEFLRGKILDQTTGEPVVFATVRIKDKAKGVVTNTDGSFRLPLYFRAAGESIEISSMGYEKTEYELLQLSPKDINIIRLTPGIISLNEAIVRGDRAKKFSARQIVRKAIENIPKNYPTKKFTSKGYYRDYQKDSLGYVNLNESLLQVFDSGFYEIDTTTTKTRIYDYVQNKNFRRDSLADDSYNYKNRRKVIDNAYLKPYGGNEFQILRVHDAIRNYQMNSYDFINNMNEGDILKNHSFKKLSDTYFEDEQLYTIRLKKVYPDYEALGFLYISKNDFAIHKLEYAVYDDRKRNSNLELRKKGIKGSLIFEVITEYKRGVDYKMFLNYISFHNTFRINLPPKFIVKDLFVSAPKGFFIINFNNKIALDNNIENNNWCDFKFRNKKIDFKKMYVLNDSSIVLIPSMNLKFLTNMFGELETMSNKRLDLNTVLDIEVSGIRDVDGNLLDEWTYKEYNQFREYFVQETKTNFNAPEEYLLMNKHKPIFEDQPIHKPDDFKEYWMNTPLKSINK
jgi:hypothetical protein